MELKKIFVSEDLKKILKKIENNSIIAKLLLTEDHPIESLQDDFVNYISISKLDITKISYLTPERMDSIPAKDYWTSSKRFFARPGSFVSKVFKNIPSKEIEIFATLFRNIISEQGLNFVILEGEDVRSAYHHKAYTAQAGTLGNSCMKSEHCQDFLSFYVDNKDLVRVVTLTKDGSSGVLGRALLWTFDDKKIMDRIYTINDEEYAHYFKMWADRNGYIYKAEQKWTNSIWFVSNGKKFISKLEIKTKSWKYNKYPYLDTFKFLDVKTGLLYNYLPEDISNIKTLCAPDGSAYGNQHLVMDDLDNLFYYYNETYYLDYAKIRVHGNKTNFSEVNNCYILRDDSEHRPDIEDYVFNSEKDQFNNKEAILERVSYYEKRRIDLEKKKKILYKDFYGEIASRMNVGAQSASEVQSPSEAAAQAADQVRRITLSAPRRYWRGETPANSNVQMTEPNYDELIENLESQLRENLLENEDAQPTPDPNPTNTVISNFTASVLRRFL